MDHFFNYYYYSVVVLIMKFAFALLPIAAVLRFVGAGPVVAEDLVCASMFSSQDSVLHPW